MKEISFGQVVPEDATQADANTTEIPVLTPEEKKQLIEDCKKFSDDVATILEAWYKGHGHIVYPLIIEAMKNIGDALMNYEERHLAKAMQQLREGKHA